MRGNFSNRRNINQRGSKRGKIPQYAQNGTHMAYQCQNQTGNYFQNFLEITGDRTETNT